MWIIQSYNFLDFSSQDDPFKTSMKVFKLGELNDISKIDAKIPLRLNDVELADDLFDPLGLVAESF